MNPTIQINQRGTLTLPKSIRDALGLAKGGAVMAETTKEGVLLRPSVAFPVEIYTDERVAAFDREDTLLRRRLTGRKGSEARTKCKGNR